tara:strand:+ start:2340 stop:2642 length:303 start_codon:yes stop_codon:yes gene_type:complete
MRKLANLELSLLALKSCDFEDYIEEINEILRCIEKNVTYENAPGLRSHDLIRVLERMCYRSSLAESQTSGYHYPRADSLLRTSSIDYIQTKVRKILIKNI